MPTVATLLAEQSRALEYTALWHTALDAATVFLARMTGRAPTYPASPPARVDQIQIVRSGLVDDPLDASTALDYGWPPEMLLGELPARPEKVIPAVGRRRCLVRALCWTVDLEDGRAYDAQWITLVPGFAPDASTLRGAIKNARLWLEQYADQLHQMTASRLLVFTAVEIAFWAQGPWAKYL